MAAVNNRRRRRRGRFGILYKLLSFVLILGAVVGGCIVFFRVQEITVVGNSVYSAEEIISAAGLEKGDNIFLIGEVSTGRKVLAALPYVNRVSIRRTMPDGIVITVSESVPAVVVRGEGGEWWLMDCGGKLLEQGGDELAQAYPQVSGVAPLMPSAGAAMAVSVSESTRLSALKEILTAMGEQGMLVQLEYIDLTAVSEIRMGYEGRFTVLMPMYSDDFHQMIHNLKRYTTSDALANGQIGTIDLTGSQDRFIPG